MSRMLAVDWSRREVRYVIASTHGGSIVVEAAESVSLPVTEGPEDDVDRRAGETLRDALASVRLNRARVLVAIDRSRSEMLHLAVPPADDSELPALVWNQAIRASQSVTEDSIVDFVAVAGQSSEPREVIAASLSVDQLERVRSTMQAAGLTTDRIVLRGFAAASLVARFAQEPSQSYLLVNLLGDEADLTVVHSGRVRFQRTVRLPADADQQTIADSLNTEIRRTLLVAPHDSTDGKPSANGNPAECIYLFGREDDHGALRERLASEDLPDVQLVDVFERMGTPATGRDRRTSLPLAIPRLSRRGRHDRLAQSGPTRDMAGASVEWSGSAGVPDDPGRFAPLLGMLLDEAQGKRHAVDFLNPKKPPKPPDRRRQLIVGGVAAAAVLLAAAIYAGQTLSDADERNRQLAEELKELDALVKRTAEKRSLVSAIENWEASNIVWLDELRDLSLKFPSGRDAVVLRMSMTPARTGGGIITLQGLARDPTVVENMEQQIRDEYREVTTPRVQQRKQDDTYAWHFDTSMFVEKREPGEYVGPSGERPLANQHSPLAGRSSQR